MPGMNMPSIFSGQQAPPDFSGRLPVTDRLNLEATVRLLQRRPTNRVDRWQDGRYLRAFETAEGVRLAADCINHVLPIARQQEVILALENHYKDGYWTYPEFAQKKEVFLRVLEAIPERTFFGVQYDPSNAMVAGDDPVELLRHVADRVVSMHASDRFLAAGATLDELRQSDGTLGYSPNLRHGVTGKGLNDYETIFRILAAQNYRGWISIEDGMNGMDEMAESLAFLRRMIAKHFSPETQ